MITKNIDLDKWDKLYLAWEEANCAALYLQNERDKKFRLHLLNLEKPLNLGCSSSIEVMWEKANKKRQEIESFIKTYSNSEVHDLNNIGPNF